MSTDVNYKDPITRKIGTGVFDCEVPTGVPVSFITVPNDWRLDPATEDYNDAYIKLKVREHIFTPYLDAINVEDQSEEAEIFTTTLKIKLKTVNGKPGFLWDFSKGKHFHKAAYNENSFGNKSIILIYDNGVHFMAQDSDGNLKGHDMGLFDTANFKHAIGSDPQKTSIMVQLTNPEEYNMSEALLDPVANGFNTANIPVIFDADIKRVSNAAAVVVLNIAADANGAIPIKGVTDDFIKTTGTAEALNTIAYDANTGLYTLTYAADVSGDYATMSWQLSDSADDLPVIEIGTKLYQGDTSN